MDIDLTAEKISVIPNKVVGVTKGLRWTKDQCLSSIELGFDFFENGTYIGSSQINLSDSTMPAAAWITAKELANSAAKTADDLLQLVAGTIWGKALIASKWKSRDFVVVSGK